MMGGGDGFCWHKGRCRHSTAAGCSMASSSSLPPSGEWGALALARTHAHARAHAPASHLVAALWFVCARVRVCECVRTRVRARLPRALPHTPPDLRALRGRVGEQAVGATQGGRRGRPRALPCIAVAVLGRPRRCSQAHPCALTFHNTYTKKPKTRETQKKAYKPPPPIHPHANHIYFPCSIAARSADGSWPPRILRICILRAPLPQNPPTVAFLHPFFSNTRKHFQRRGKDMRWPVAAAAHVRASNKKRIEGRA